MLIRTPTFFWIQQQSFLKAQRQLSETMFKKSEVKLLILALTVITPTWSTRDYQGKWLFVYISIYQLFFS